MDRLRFSELIGNTTTSNLIQRSLARGTFNQVTLFEGVLGTGKSSSAALAAMTLTCEHPHEGQACLECPTCRNNVKALRNGESSASIKVIDMSKLNVKKDINELIEEVFQMTATDGNQVFILEEVHVLHDIPNGQTALLYALDRIPSNTYVIMCTTRASDLIEELRSRTMKFRFQRLNKTECELLLKTELDRRMIAMQPEIRNLLVRNCKGIPRTLLKLLDFTVDNVVTLQELRSMLQVIDDSVFLELFSIMDSKDNATFIELVEKLTDGYSIEAIVNGLKEFIVNITFAIDGANNGMFNRTEMEEIKRLFNLTKRIKITNVVKRLTENSSMVDVKLAFIDMQLIMQGMTQERMIVDKQRVGAMEKATSDNVVRQSRDSRPETVTLTPLRLNR